LPVREKLGYWLINLGSAEDLAYNFFDRYRFVAGTSQSHSYLFQAGNNGTRKNFHKLVDNNGGS
jgi:hypothetical protein